MTEATFTTHRPATGEVYAEYLIHGESQVRDAVERARPAGRAWAAQQFARRRKMLLAWKRYIAAHLDEPAELIAAETGKPSADARAEVLLALVHLDWAARNAKRVLGRRRVSSGVFAVHQSSSVAYRPVGVVGVIGPWNYPMYTPLGSVGHALAAGNAVVLKPSEFAPGVAVWLARSFGSLHPVFEDVLQVVTGSGGTGEALARSGVDKLAFTGSPATARKVAAACAESLTAFVAEGGGKDAALVAADADVTAAAEAIVWAAMGNAGQTCVGIERVYAVASVYDELCRKVVERARTLTPGEHYGPMTTPAQIGVVSRHIAAALADGGTALLGGPESVRAPFIDPVVLTEVPEASAAMREETFGPVVIINKVADMDEAIARANNSPYALGGAVFGKGHAARAAAAQLRSGNVSVNSTLGYAAVPALPLGGSGDSGYGRLHGADGLRTFTSPQAVTALRFTPPIDMASFATNPQKIAKLVNFARRWHSR